MKILIILLLSLNVAYLLELNVTTKHVNKILISNGKKFDAEKYPCVDTTSLSTCKNATDYQYNNTCTGSLVKQKYVLTSSLAPRWLNKINKSNIKFQYSIATVTFIIALTVAVVIALTMAVVIALTMAVVVTIAVAVVFGVAVSVVVTVAMAIVIGVAMSTVVTIAVAAVIKAGIAIVTVAVAVIVAV